MNNEPQDDKDKLNTRSQRLRQASKQRREEEKQEVRQLILQASIELFLENGYQAFSLRQVAERIGYSPGTIYLYFQDKDEVLYTVMREGFTRFSEMVLRAADVPDPRARLLAIRDTYIDFGISYPAYYQLMFMQRTDYLIRTTDNELQQPIATLFGVWRSSIEDAMRAGVLPLGNPQNIADTIWALLHGVVSMAILMPNFDVKRAREMAETGLSLFMAH